MDCPQCNAVRQKCKKFHDVCSAGSDHLAQSHSLTAVGQQLMASRIAYRGERHHVTILFADINKSMELLANRDPEEACALLDPILQRLMTAVHGYEGMVNQVLGDGIMAIFGAPMAHKDHAIRACYAALAMQESIRHYNADRRRMDGIESQIRVGLNSGEVMLRAMRNDLQVVYSAVGQTTHLAARMEQLAPPGRIWLTAETLDLAQGLVQVNALGPVEVKGIKERREVFELVGINT